MGLRADPTGCIVVYQFYIESSNLYESKPLLSSKLESGIELEVDKHFLRFGVPAPTSSLFSHNCFFDLDNKPVTADGKGFYVLKSTILVPYLSESALHSPFNR